jgi:hypothetical protein
MALLISLDLAGNLRVILMEKLVLLVFLDYGNFPAR